MSESLQSMAKMPIGDVSQKCRKTINEVDKERKKEDKETWDNFLQDVEKKNTEPVAWFLRIFGIKRKKTSFTDEEIKEILTTSVDGFGFHNYKYPNQCWGYNEHTARVLLTLCDDAFSVGVREIYVSASDWENLL